MVPRRSIALVALTLSVLELLASGCAPVAEAHAQGGTCGDVRWGGYDGEPRCAALARRTIRGSDRGCSVDADCSLIHPGASCREQAVATAHLATYRAQEASCTHPAGGPCAPTRAACDQGCCVEVR